MTRPQITMVRASDFSIMSTFLRNFITKGSMLALLAMVAVALQAQAEDIPEETAGIFERYIDLGRDLSDVMESVKDRQSAEVAASKLNELLPRVGKSRREIGCISSLSPELAAQVIAVYEKPMRTVWGKVFDCIYRLQRVRCYECVPFFRSFSILCSLLDS